MRFAKSAVVVICSIGFGLTFPDLYEREGFRDLWRTMTAPIG